MGTAGQRCTSTRRVIVHESVETKLLQALLEGYKQVRIGNPLDPETLMGPLIDFAAVENFTNTLTAAKQHGGRVLTGGKLQ